MGALASSQLVGLGVFLAYLIMRKRHSTKDKHKLHSIMLLVGGYGLASLTGAFLIGVIRLIRVFTDWAADRLHAFLPSYLGFLGGLVRIIPDALPYALLIAIPFIVLLEVWPNKWTPRWLRGHFSSSEDHHTAKFAFLVAGIVAQVPFAAAAFSLGGLIQAVNG